MSHSFIHSRKLLLEKDIRSDWANEMVLNPSIIKDRETGRIHMLFRATGSWDKRRISGRPLPYPIFLGWQFDMTKPALSPQIRYDIEEIFIKNYQGENVVNYANGCIEDPRLFYFMDECYLTVACRMFPPGPYWIKDDPMQCAPDWAVSDNHPFGLAAKKNYTVNVLFKVNLAKLSNKEYEAAFEYVTHVTNPIFGEDRDVVFFPRKLEINGRKKIVMLQRPFNPDKYPTLHERRPSIIITSGNDFEDFASEKLEREILASPKFVWESNRIGASAPPIYLGNSEWLLNYHGKQDDHIGYTQSFMILKERNNGFPEVIYRCEERLITPEESWEQPNKFKVPCI